MSKVLTARLQELLDIREAEMRDLQHQLDRYREVAEEVDWRWARHRRQPVGGLPVPRLQLSMLRDEGYAQEWDLCLVVRTWGSDENMIPITASRRSGGSLLRVGSDFPLTSKASILEFDFLPGIFTDLVRTAKSMPGIMPVVVIGEHGWRWEVSDAIPDGERMVKIMGPVLEG